jgi:predicted AAA+ superfamily ATPase
VVSGPRQSGKTTIIGQALREVDFVLEKGGRLAAIEVKSGRVRNGIPGIGLFLKRNPGARAHQVGFSLTPPKY